MFQGLKDATVCFFPEEYCKENAVAGTVPGYYDGTPNLNVKMELVNDPLYGIYYKTEHLNGEIIFYMPKE